MPVDDAAFSMVGTAGPPLGSRHAEVPRERSFTDGLHIPMDAIGAKTCAEVVGTNLDYGVTWARSYVTPDKTKTYCVYEAPSPEAVRQRATANNLPVDWITEVRHHTNPNRCGGQDPAALIIGELYDFAELHHEKGRPGGPTPAACPPVGVSGSKPGAGASSGPARTTPSNLWRAPATQESRRSAYHPNTYGQRVVVGSHDYGDDEPL
jgi:Protein of unknown function (DUF4242)